MENVQVLIVIISVMYILTIITIVSLILLFKQRYTQEGIRLLKEKVELEYKLKQAEADKAKYDLENTNLQLEYEKMFRKIEDKNVSIAEAANKTLEELERK